MGLLHIGHLVNGAGDKTVDVLIFPEYLGEGGAERWGSLHSWEPHFPDVVRVLEPKDALALVGGHTLLYAQDLPVKVGLRAVRK